MINRRQETLLLGGFTVLLMVFQGGCAKTESTSKSEPAPGREATVQESAVTVPSPIPAATPPPLPRPAEVREKVAGIYQEAVRVVAENAPHLFAGDFNGDSSQDLAVVVVPVEGKLDAINSEVANWMIREPRSTRVPDLYSRKPQASPTPVKVARKDLLLAVIHGHGSSGWRNSAARHAFLLRNAVGEGMELQSALAALDSFKKVRRQPYFSGDVVRQRLEGEEGVLYWTGSEYGWYPLRPPRA